MRMAAIAAGLTLMAGAALAQSAAPAPPPLPLGPPKAFAGYSQPEISADACRAVNDSQVQCVIPGMTMGRYMIVAAGTSTWAAADASQALGIQVGVTPCGNATDKAPWTKGPRTFKLGCVATVLTDRPLTVYAVYKDAHATKDPHGPTLIFRPLPWEGVIGAAPFVPKQ